MNVTNPTLKPYPTYKDSGVPSLGEIPTHWEVKRQRNIADMLVSNVDKLSVDGEVPVRLCNYVDVYKNDHITERIQFMRATASAAEIDRFRLRLGDVLITKDSESWNDIGVPSLVEYIAEDLVCGYHLALLRPRPNVILGSFLLRAIQSRGVSIQYHVAANGVTRYGLSQNAIKSVLVPVPPLDEQHHITAFLTHIDHRVNRLIRIKRRLIVLLNEQKQAIIHRAVTCGLDPDVRLKPSGVAWLGEVPEHWEVRRAKYLFREIDHRSTTGSEVLLSLRMYQGLVPHNEVSQIPIGPDNLVGFKKVQPGQVVMNRMRAAIGLFGVASSSGLVSPDYAIFETLQPLIPEYFLYLFKTRVMGTVFRLGSKGLGTGSSGFMRLYTDRFGRITLPFPPVNEQAAILQGIAQATRELEQVITRTQREIDLIREYRTRLVADVVTGNLDVRGVDLAAYGDEIAELGEVLAEEDDVGEEEVADEVEEDAG